MYLYEHDLRNSCLGAFMSSLHDSMFTACMLANAVNRELLLWRSRGNWEVIGSVRTNFMHTCYHLSRSARKTVSTRMASCGSSLLKQRSSLNTESLTSINSSWLSSLFAALRWDSKPIKNWHHHVPLFNAISKLWNQEVTAWKHCKRKQSLASGDLWGSLSLYIPLGRLLVPR